MPFNNSKINKQKWNLKIHHQAAKVYPQFWTWNLKGFQWCLICLGWGTWAWSFFAEDDATVYEEESSQPDLLESEPAPIQLQSQKKIISFHSNSISLTLTKGNIKESDLLYVLDLSLEMLWIGFQTLNLLVRWTKTKKFTATPVIKFTFTDFSFASQDLLGYFLHFWNSSEAMGVEKKERKEDEEEEEKKSKNPKDEKIKRFRRSYVAGICSANETSVSKRISF